MSKLQGVDILPGSDGSAVVHQVRLEAARCLSGPGEPFHGRLSEELVGRLGFAPWQLGSIQLEALQQPLERGPADARQVGFHLGRQDQLLPPGQLLGRRQQSWGQALRTHVVQALPDHPDHVGHRRPVVPSPHAGSLGSPLQRRPMQQPEQALAVQPCHCCHLSEQPAPLRPPGLSIPGRYQSQVLASFVYGHLVFSRHRPPSNILS